MKPAPLQGGDASDYVGFRTVPKLMALIDGAGERLLFADKIKKFSQGRAWKQERTFVITNEAIYNIKKDKVKRQIRLS